MDLDSMKYADLRSLAKELGLKANMKADKLLKAIKQHYEQERQQQPEDGKEPEGGAPDAQENKNGAPEEEDAACDERVPTKLFVTKRRGKGAKAKRKISDTDGVAECDPNLTFTVAEKDDEVAESGSTKRRRVSSSRQAGTNIQPNDAQPNTEQPPEVKDEAHMPGNGENEPKAARAGKIPRHEGLLRKSKPLLKPNTPNFKKLHEAHFNKMESIDNYMQRKNKQMEAYRNSVKELKKLSEKTISQKTGGKIQTAKSTRSSMFSPVVPNKRPDENKRRASALSASKPPPNKPAQKEDAPFRPSVLSTRRINVRFSQATQDNEHKGSLLKTPARMSPYVTSSTPGKLTSDGEKPNNIKSSALSATKTPGAFVFTANTSISNTPGTKKPVFDLKASLSRPLGYKPHKGKLKPFADVKENTAANKSLISHSHQKNYKKHQVQTREDRRAKHKDDRKQKKESMLGARRGLVLM
ncbi:nucleolar and spindle-associated protein 1 [Myripristis murdjan]|uniref:Nucleolar and spindle associated protein 1 n=1 Tax=Myripristis murdjan TaxID=586833 RepID=A0A667YIV1_9TELE|nr:nucleolar and spindle-associated protein 1 [Myripristis murdjan]